MAAQLQATNRIGGLAVRAKRAWPAGRAFNSDNFVCDSNPGENELFVIEIETLNNSFFCH